MRLEIIYQDGHGDGRARTNPRIIDDPYNYEFRPRFNYLRVYRNRFGHREFGLDTVKAVKVDGATVYTKDDANNAQYG